MHELLLHAPVPASRQWQVLSILAGLAAMQPIPLREHVQLYKPNRLREALRTVQVGAVQGVSVPKSQAAQMQAAMAGDLFYLRVVQELIGGSQDVEKSDEATRVKGTTKLAVEDGDGMDVDSVQQPVKSPPQATDTESKGSQPTRTQTPALLQFRDVPEPTRQKDHTVTSRLIASIPITGGPPNAFMAAIDYSPTSVYQTEGHRLSHNNISLHLYRVLVPSGPVSSGFDPGQINTADLRLLDECGAYILQASVRVQDGSKVETVQRGAAELLGLKEALRGVVELEVVERLSLDTRVR